MMGAKYKPVAKKVIPVSTYDPNTVIPKYMPLELKELPLLTTNPCKMEDIIFTEQLTKERIEIIIGNIPNGFLSKAELELILDVIFEFENAFAFMHSECGTFNTKYYPECYRYLKWLGISLSLSLLDYLYSSYFSSMPLKCALMLFPSKEVFIAESCL